jgi:xanthine dehydrogenase YagT iron-sulfur-binding subunit
MADDRFGAGSGVHRQARRLAEAARPAPHAGDEDRSDRMPAEADRAAPQAVQGVSLNTQSVSLETTTDRAARPGHAPDAAVRQLQEVPRTVFDIELTVNGSPYRLTVDARTTLLDALRDRLHLTGTKRGCDLGQCGACTVLLDGRCINACLMLAVMARGHAIATIEGLAADGRLHPVQQAFVDHDAFQCGYCTPGQIMSAIGLIAEGRATTDAAIREHMSGNICRCGAYTNIVDAVRHAARPIEAAGGAEQQEALRGDPRDEASRDDAHREASRDDAHQASSRGNARQAASRDNARQEA